MAERSDKYILSLDAVDINLLSMNFKSKYDNYTQLWPGNDMRNDYYEFEIRNVDDDEDDEIPNITCHMCNIEVPESYLKHHNDSFKHRINMKIADTVLERLKKNIHINNYCNEEPNKSLHFCPVCVTVIKIKDKIKHEKSVAHKNSMIVDKYLHDFYVFYSDDSKENDVGNLNLNTNKPDTNLACDIEFLSAKSEIDCDIDSSFILKDIIDKISDRTSKINHDTIHTNDAENAHVNDDEIVEFTNNKINKKNKKKAKGSEEKIISETLQVKEVVNEAIEPINDLEPGDTSKNVAKLNKTKAKKQKSKTKDNNGDIKKNTLISKETQNKSENIVIEEVKHDAKFVSKVIKTTPNSKINDGTKNINKTTDNQGNDLICKICDNKNEDHALCIYLEEALTNFSEIPQIWDVINTVQYHLVMRSDTPFCMVCKINCLFVNVIAHLFSDDHFAQYEKLVKENFLISDDIYTACQACNVKVKKELELLHCEDMTHITRQEMHKKKQKK